MFDFFMVIIAVALIALILLAMASFSVLTNILDEVKFFRLFLREQLIQKQKEK